jgi:hypothetical protein
LFWGIKSDHCALRINIVIPGINGKGVKAVSQTNLDLLFKS